VASRPTRIAQASIFCVGDVSLPTIPALNAVTVLMSHADALAPIDRKSLTRSRKSVCDGFYYGAMDTPTTVALTDVVTELEGGAASVLTPSGQSALVAAMTALLRKGDHLLVVDTITYSSRWYIDQQLAASGIEVSYYSPELGEDILRLFKPNTRAILMESPGSFTFEVQDVPAICSAASRHGILTVLDNTWAASTFFAPFQHGVDVSILSLTKCHVGPSGVSLGAVVTRNALLYAEIKNTVALFGLHVSSEDCSRAALALTTLDLRLRRQEESVAVVLAGLAGHREIRRIFHPRLPGAAGHAFWSRDFSGSTSLISIAFLHWSQTDARAFLDRLRVIRIGHGWGGTISLASLFEANQWRTLSRADASGVCLRLYIGLEDPQDLLTDLLQALDRHERRPSAMPFTSLQRGKEIQV
jgi:cysteine-S-conjugate beta-lyase